MLQDDFKRFNAVMNGMAKIYERELDAVVLDVYWLSLSDWTLTDFESAVRHLVRTCRFMPRPIDFSQLAKAGKPSAAEAWIEVLDHARHDSPNFMNGHVNGLSELANRALRAIGGLHTVAMSDISKTTFLEKRFAEVYDQMGESDEIRDSVPGIAFDRGRLSGPTSIRNLLGGRNGATDES